MTLEQYTRHNWQRSAGILILSLLVGCATSETGGGKLPGQSVRPVSKIVVMSIPDGVERHDGPAAGSGAAMTAGVRDALIHAGQSPLVTEAVGFEATLSQAKRLEYDYVLKAIIVEWEDNATEWSGRPDSAAMSAELYEVSSGKLVSTATHREKGSAMALVPMTPDRFIPTISRRIVERLLGVTLTEPSQSASK